MTYKPRCIGFTLCWQLDHNGGRMITRYLCTDGQWRSPIVIGPGQAHGGRLYKTEAGATRAAKRHINLGKSVVVEAEVV